MKPTKVLFRLEVAVACSSRVRIGTWMWSRGQRGPLGAERRRRLSRDQPAGATLGGPAPGRASMDPGQLGALLRGATQVQAPSTILAPLRLAPGRPATAPSMLRHRGMVERPGGCNGESQRSPLKRAPDADTLAAIYYKWRIKPTSHQGIFQRSGKQSAWRTATAAVFLIRRR